MAQTGMETAEILKGIIKETKPDLIIAIDALAARSVKRLGTTIQLTDTEFIPVPEWKSPQQLNKRKFRGTGHGNRVPTVVGAAAIVHDTVTTLIRALSENMETKGMGDFMENLNSMNSMI